MHFESSDDTYQILNRWSWTDGETLRLPEGLSAERWVRVNNALVSRGAVRRPTGEYAWRPGGLACLIVCDRFVPRKRRPPRKAVAYQKSLFRVIFERLGLHVPVITIVGVRVGEAARAETLGDDLKSFQGFVGGDMEMHGIGNGIAVVCNDDGINLGLPENGVGMLGPWFYTKCDEAGNNVSLSDDEVSACLAHWASYRMMRHGGKAGFEVKSFGSIEEMWAYRDRQRREAGEAN